MGDLLQSLAAAISTSTCSDLLTLPDMTASSPFSTERKAALHPWEGGSGRDVVPGLTTVLEYLFQRLDVLSNSPKQLRSQGRFCSSDALPVDLLKLPPEAQSFNAGLSLKELGQSVEWVG